MVGRSTRASESETLPTRRYVALAIALLASACAGGATIPDSQAWMPQPEGGDGSSSSGGIDEGEDEGEAVCEPGDVAECLCVDATAGERTCLGDGWSTCECDAGGSDDGEASSTGGDEESGGETGAAPANEACFPGPANDWTTCLPLHEFGVDDMPSGYGYPDALEGDPNYRKPLALIDLMEVDPATYLAPNFQLLEIATIEKGRWAIVQPHAVASLQELRDALGAIGVNSGYRSPEYNSQIGGATWSRHMYGDGFDLAPLDVGLGTLETQCTSIGGMLVEYDTHVHCDFRFDDVDPGFFGAAAPDGGFELELTASIVDHGDGVHTAPAEGFDEGEPKRRWTARAADGSVIATGQGAIFVAPRGTSTVEVVVGGVVALSRAP